MKKQKANSHEGITSFEMAKQNIQAKEVYCTPLSRITITKNVDFKSVWYRFGSLANTIDPSNRIIVDLFVDHYYTVTKINTVCQ